MSGSRLSKFPPQQLVIWGSVIALLLLLGIRYFIFFSDPESAAARMPKNVRSSRDKLTALSEARQAVARRGTIDYATIPDREYGVIVNDDSAADDGVPYPADDQDGVQSATLSPVAESQVPELRGIVQSRDMEGNVTLRACYPRTTVTVGGSIEGYRVTRITTDQVTLLKDGRELVQKVVDNRFLQKR